VGSDKISNGIAGKLKTVLFGRSDNRSADPRLEAFLDAVPSEYCGFAPDGTVAYSEGFCALLGLMGVNTLHDIQAILTPGDAALLEGRFMDLHDHGRPFTITVQNQGQNRSFRIAGRHGNDSSDTQRFDILWLEDATQSRHDLDRLDQAQERAGAERDRLQAAFDMLPSPAWMRNERTDLVWCNRAYARAFDTSPATVIAEQKELPAKPVRRGAAASRPTGRALAQAAMDSAGIEQCHAHVIIDGRRHLFQITERALQTHGHERMTLGEAADLSREEELETEYRRYTAANNELLEQLGTAIGIYDSAQKLEFFNAAYAQLWGLEDTYLNGHPRLGEVMEKLRENRRLPEQADFRRFKQGWLNMFTGLIGPHEDMLYLPDNTALRMLVVPHPMGGLMMTFEDVSSRLELESSYNTLVAVQKETLDNLSEGVAVFGGDGKLKLWNPSFARLWTLQSEDLKGEPHVSRVVERLSSAFDPAVWIYARERLLAQCLDRRMEKGRLEGHNGLQIAYSTVPLPDGGVLVTHVDVTDTARVENALRDKNAALEAAERLKLDFLANVSYQLRTPLSTIVGFAEILANEYFGALNARQKEYTIGMREAGERLVALVNDILDLSTIEAGYMTLEKTNVLVRPVLAGLQDLVEEWARKERIEIRLDCPQDIGFVVADERRLRQVLLNLIRNSISFTPPGGVITLSALDKGEVVEFAVSDTGQGIAELDQERIFEPFERVHGSANQNGSRGAGLGLALVRDIVELHNGTVTIESLPGMGTTVRVTLPALSAEDSFEALLA
jgi:signal transduction histidine kinase